MPSVLLRVTLLWNKISHVYTAASKPRQTALVACACRPSSSFIPVAFRRVSVWSSPVVLSSHPKQDINEKKLVQRYGCHTAPSVLYVTDTRVPRDATDSWRDFLTPAGCCGLHCGKHSWKAGPGEKVQLRNKRIGNFPRHLTILL